MQRYEAATREQVENLLAETRANQSLARRRKKRTPGQIIRSVLSLLVVLALAATLGMLLKTRLEGGYPSLFGYRIFRVETGSMIPTLPIGSVILVHQPEDPGALGIGTVITYRYKSAVVTHRIVDYVYTKDPDTGETAFSYQTKGDNPENALDPWTVDPGEILGELIWHFAL